MKILIAILCLIFLISILHGQETPAPPPPLDMPGLQRILAEKNAMTDEIRIELERTRIQVDRLKEDVKKAQAEKATAVGAGSAVTIELERTRIQVERLKEDVKKAQAEKAKCQ